MPSGPPAHLTRIGIESPLALFAPPHRIDSLIPAPLYLLELAPGTLKTSYPTNERGFIANDEDSHLERTIVYEDGSRCTVNVQGSQKLGLPNQFDWDYLLALFRIADEGGVEADGTVRDPSFRAILRAAGRSDDAGKNYTAAVKRAMARWAAVTVRTRWNLDFANIVEQVREGGKYPLLPDGYPERHKRERTHNVVVYDISSVERRGDEYDRIDLLRIDPVWLDQPLIGFSAWLDVERHNSLRSALAKRIYQVLALRMARGVRPPFVILMDDFLEEIAFTNSQKPGAKAKQISAALKSLEKINVVLSSSVREVERGAYEVVITPGERLHAAALFRGIGADDRVRTRALLWHLGVQGISIPTGRILLRSHPTQSLNALRRAYYIQSERKGVDLNGKPVLNWGGWLRDAIEKQWSFNEPEYLQWLDRKSAQALEESGNAPEISLAGAEAEATPGHPAVEEISPPVDELPDDEWGRARERFRPQIPAQAFDTWLRNTWQVTAGEGVVVIGTANPFAASWITDKYRDVLSAILTEIIGEPVVLTVEHHDPPPSA